ncbi:MAG TPA: hypothetical protein VKE40_05685 [Gemmataceae bacterium]|nr:hypothetical protein [Gemmataceae bacterium]
MLLLTLFAALTIVVAAVLWLVSVLGQGWLYNDLARHLPLRALAGGAVMSLFLTAWCAIYRADPGRFDTLVSFKTERLEGTYDEFESIRKVGKDEKKPVRFIRRGETNDFESAENRKPWNRSDADGMVVALLIREKGKDQPTRFDANIKPDGTFPQPEDTKFEADRGRRYMDQSGLGKVYRKRSMAVIGNLFANGLHLALWVAVLWPVMRFTLGHAVGFGLVLWGVTMIAVQPALFGLVTK